MENNEKASYIDAEHVQKLLQRATVFGVAILSSGIAILIAVFSFAEAASVVQDANGLESLQRAIDTWQFTGGIQTAIGLTVLVICSGLKRMVKKAQTQS